MHSQTPEAVRHEAAVLLAAIEAEPLCDAHSPEVFAHELAERQRWTWGHTQQVLAEYRRFLVLTRLAGHAVCPSVAVDEAWHWHLTKTRAYAGLCAAHLGGWLHHEPTRGGRAEAERHDTMYRDTLLAYERLFGHAAPAALWPPPQLRFARADPAPTDRWPLRLPPALGSRAALGNWASRLALLLALALGFGVDAASLAGHPAIALIDGLLWVGLALWAAHALWRMAVGSGAHAQTAPQGLDAYEAAWLQGGAARVQATAIVDAVTRGWCRLDHARNRTGHVSAGSLVVDPALARGASHAADAHPALRAMGAALEDGKRIDSATLRRRLAPAVADLQQRLVVAGLAHPSDRLGLAAAALLLAASALALWCGARTVLEWRLGTPAHALPHVLLASWALYLSRRALRESTPAGQRALRALGRALATHPAAPVQAGRALPTRVGNPAAATDRSANPVLAFALWGSVALMGNTAYAGINPVLREGHDVRAANGQSPPLPEGGGMGAGAPGGRRATGFEAAGGGCGGACGGAGGCGGGGCGGGGCGGGA